MTDNEFLLQDRAQKIQQVIGKYGEENFYISFSGGDTGKDMKGSDQMATVTKEKPELGCKPYYVAVDFCQVCNNEVYEGDVFCASCGQRIRKGGQ